MKIEELIDKVICGDCIDVMKTMPDNSVDAIVTDPPYGLGFMGKEWDTFDKVQFGIAGNEGANDLKVKKNFKVLPRYSTDGLYDFTKSWATECLRVLKPGGYLLAFAGTRTQHKICIGIEDGGFEIRDMIIYCYGSGFPKSLNIGKAIDKLQGNEREVVGKKDGTYADIKRDKETGQDGLHGGVAKQGDRIEVFETKGSSEWEGWGTALKPAFEPIIYATKSFINKELHFILCDVNKNLMETIWQSIENTLKQDISKLQETVLIHLNIVLLWKNILGESFKNENKFTTSMVSKIITDLKILNSLLLKSTQEDMGGEYQIYQSGTQKSPVSGLDLLVNVVENCLAEEKWNISNIQKLIAQGLVIYKQNKNGTSVKSVERDLLPIILNANFVLVNVLTNITTELKQKELNIFVNFAEKSLKQYLAEPQSIVELGVWRNHIQKILPNCNPITVARKPLSEKTVVENVLKWGVGGINIDGCRVGTESISVHNAPKGTFAEGEMDRGSDTESYREHTGRFPANLIHDGSEEVVSLFPSSKGNGSVGGGKGGIWTKGNKQQVSPGYEDSGSASRFFYCAKASKAERNKGCERLEENVSGTNAKGYVGDGIHDTKPRVVMSKNNHPTVKPVALMEYLVKLVSREGSIVLDPFTGSGTTGVACHNLDRKFIGIEKSEDYIKIANSRLEQAYKNLKQEELF